MSEWQTIDSAPKTGERIVLGNKAGAWIGYWHPVLQSGYRKENPWSTAMLNHDHIADRLNCYAAPTHWQPLPAPPES